MIRTGFYMDLPTVSISITEEKRGIFHECKISMLFESIQFEIVVAFLLVSLILLINYYISSPFITKINNSDHLILSIVHYLHQSCFLL